MSRWYLQRRCTMVMVMKASNRTGGHRMTMTTSCDICGAWTPPYAVSSLTSSVPPFHSTTLGSPASNSFVAAGKGNALIPSGRAAAPVMPCFLCLVIAFHIKSLRASVTSTIPPSAPGTFPCTRTNCLSRSTRNTLKLCTVALLPPSRPAIFFPGKTRPGSWCCPVLPCER